MAAGTWKSWESVPILEADQVLGTRSSSGSSSRARAGEQSSPGTGVESSPVAVLGARYSTDVNNGRRRRRDTVTALMMGVLDFFLGLLPSWARLAVYALRCVACTHPAEPEAPLCMSPTTT